MTPGGEHMVKHVVMWKLKDQAQGATKEQNAEKIKAMLMALPSKIAAIENLEVGIDFIHSDMSADVVLVTQVASKEALDTYRLHPDHQAVIPFIQEVTAERRVVDFEC